MRTFIVLFLLMIPILSKSDVPEAPQGFALWDAQRVEETADRLETQLRDKAIVYETIGTYKGHSMYLVLRGKTGAAEFHETESDFQIGLRGTATLVIGGQLVNPEQRPRKQQRGSSIKGGASFPLAPGDIIHVPVAVPHQIIIEPDQPYMYILIKLDEEPRQDAAQ